MTRAIHDLFRTSPYWGWMLVGVVFLGLLLAWLLAEWLGKRSPRGSRIVARVRSTVFTAFVVSDLIVLLLLASLHSARVDLTKDNLYSLSPSSRALVADLGDTMTVEVFFPEDLPADLVPLREGLIELLAEYRAASGGQMVVRQLDPVEPGVLDRAKGLGIEPAPFMVMENEQPVQKEIVRGLAITYRGRTEIVSPIDRDIGIEYQISSLILTLTGTPRKIAFLTGHKELDGALEQPQMLDTLKKILPYHEIITLDLQGGARPVPEDVTGLILTTPADPISEAELYQIDQFLMRGGAIAYFGNGFTVIQPPPQMRMMGQQQMPEVRPLDTGLAAFLAHFGVLVGDDLVLDDDQADGVPQVVVGARMTRGGSIVPEYAKRTSIFWTKDIDESHPITSGLTNTLVYEASSIDLSEDVRGRTDVAMHVLMRSPEQSWLGTSSETMFPMLLGSTPPQEPAELGPDASEDARALATRGPRPLLVAVEGTMHSYFEGKEVPSPATAGENRLNESAKTVRVMGFGSPVLLDPRLLQAALQRRKEVVDLGSLLLNTADWLASEKGLLEVRGKTPEPPVFSRDPTPSHQFWAKLTLVGGVPILFLAVGLGGLFVVRLVRRGSRGAPRSPEKGAAAAGEVKP